MNIVVTCGPAAAPVDEVRRLTNLSTGRLGVTLANALTAAGHRVFCCKGEGATFPGRLRAHALSSYLTNDDLAGVLRALARQERVEVVFHAAALCDFEVARILDPQGRVIRSRKVSSRTDRLLLELKPASKLLPKLRRWFPQARIVGWKYEMEGSTSDAIKRAREQVAAVGSAGCVANGAAFGEGFAFCAPDGSVRELPDLRALVRFLVRWVGASEPTAEARRTQRGLARHP